MTTRFGGVLIVLFALAAPAAAESLPSFDLSECTERAKAVVRGRLDPDGTLKVTATLKGELPDDSPFKLEGGDRFHRDMNEAMGGGPGALDVVAYLEAPDGREQRRVVWWNAGVVGFRGDGVYLIGDSPRKGGGGPPTKHHAYTPDTFLAAARVAVAAETKRGELLAEPPSAKRAREIVAFLQSQRERALWFHESRLLKTLMPPHPDEERAFVRALADADSRDRPWLIDLIGPTCRGEAAFDAVAPFIDSNQPGDVRRAAMRAAAQIDPRRSQAKLLPLLDIAEPDLIAVLSGLFKASEWCPDPAAVEPLLTLAQHIRTHRQTLPGNPMAQASWDLVGVLGAYGHPKMVLALSDWGVADAGLRGQVRHVLCGLTGLPFTEENLEFWKGWSKQAKRFLDPAYDLLTPSGRQAWYKAWRAADDGTRRVLVRLWLYEWDIDEATLVREAADRTGGEAAKAALACLWERGRLSAAAKASVVATFLTARLEEVTFEEDPARREMQVRAERNFPFPKETWVQYRYAGTWDGTRPNLAGDFGNTRALDGTGPLDLGGYGTGALRGKPQTRAVLEMRQEAKERQAGWSRAWELGPIVLREAK